jgi:hypothetical protein
VDGQCNITIKAVDFAGLIDKQVDPMKAAAIQGLLDACPAGFFAAMIVPDDDEPIVQWVKIPNELESEKGR